MWEGGTRGAKASGISTSRGVNWASLIIKLGPAQTRQPNTETREECEV